MDEQDVDIRVASLETRLKRLTRLPLAKHATLEERLAEVERRVSELQVIVALLGVQMGETKLERLERLEEAIAKAERGRGYW